MRQAYHKPITCLSRFVLHFTFYSCSFNSAFFFESCKNIYIFSYSIKFHVFRYIFLSYASLNIDSKITKKLAKKSCDTAGEKSINFSLFGICVENIISLHFLSLFLFDIRRCVLFCCMQTFLNIKIPQQIL